MSKKYPRQIFLVREQEGSDEEFLMVLDKPLDVNMDEDTKRIVAKYELVDTVTVTKNITVK